MLDAFVCIFVSLKHFIHSKINRSCCLVNTVGRNMFENLRMMMVYYLFSIVDYCRISHYSLPPVFEYCQGFLEIGKQEKRREMLTERLSLALQLCFIYYIHILAQNYWRDCGRNLGFFM